MDLTRRQQEILEIVRDSGFASVDRLAQHFNVTPQTIRRDVNLLCRESVLQRYHGGVGPASSVENLTYDARKRIGLSDKRRIARAVAREIPNNASLFINIGTTTEAVANALLGHSGLRVITNNINVANILRKNSETEVIIAGGVVRTRDGGVVGGATVDFIRQFKVDYGVIGISGIDGDGTLLDYDYREVRVAQAIIANSRKIYLAADHSKFSRNALVRLGSLVDIDALFTDRPPPPVIGKLMTEHDIRVVVAAEDGTDLDPASQTFEGTSASTSEASATVMSASSEQEL